jgi:hypothetical protein
MIINDRAYGKIEITDPLIIDLLNTAPMQRLKGINQSSASAFLEPQRNVTRFEHSVGVWYLLKRYGAGKEEQVAGLLHDTPHTVFSHVIDVVFPNVNHNYHEKFADKIILSSDIPQILGKYGLKVENILDKENFPLLEADLPDLSADRIDYFLRDTRWDQLFPDSMVVQFLDGIFVREAKFYFKDKSLASLYAILFINAGRLQWLDPNSHGSYILLAEAVKRALKLKYLTENDLFKTDKEVIGILIKSKDAEIKKYLDRLNPKTKFIYVDAAMAEFTGPNKPRVVDPLVDVDGKLIRISVLIPRLKELFDHFKKTYQIISVSQVKV